MTLSGFKAQNHPQQTNCRICRGLTGDWKVTY